jgi:hypothetical protein
MSKTVPLTAKVYGVERRLDLEPLLLPVGPQAGGEPAVTT